MSKDFVKSRLGLSEGQLEKIYTNKDFLTTLAKLEDSNPRFSQLPNSQKKLALAMFLMGDMEAVPNLWKLFYKRPIPSIEEFLTQDYIGSDARFYPEDSPWRKDLIKIFDESSTYWEWIATGAIGTAKSAATRIGHFYNLYRITSLKNPQLAMGSGETKPLCLMFLTVTKLKAHEAFEGIRTLLQQCKYFHKVDSEEGFSFFDQEEYSSVVPYYEHTVEGFPRITFPKSVYIGSGSRLSHTIGSDIFGASLDEAEFRGKANSSNNSFELYSELCSRVNSRFIDAKFKLVTLVSSVKHETGIVAEHINSIDPASGMTYLSSYPIWEIKEQYKNAFDKYGYFYAFRGTRAHPSKLLDEEDTALMDNGNYFIPENCKVVKVPNHPILYKAFRTNVERALMEQAGEVTSGGERPFDDLSMLEDKLLVDEIHFVAPLPDEKVESKSLFNQLPFDMWIKTPDGLRLRRYPNCKRYMHLDLADTGEAGISMCHKEISLEGKIMYVFDFLGKVTSPNKISQTMIEDFLFELKEVGNINLESVTADQYGSLYLLQRLGQRKLAKTVAKMAMGTKPEPFNAVGTLISESSVKTGMSPELKSQLKGVYFYEEKVQYETDRKDIADTFIGTVYAALNNSSDIPVNVYEAYQNIQNSINLSEIEGLIEL